MKSAEFFLRRSAMPGITGNRAAMVQGYLAHKKQRPPRTPQKDYTYDPSVVLGGGGLLLISEVPM